MRYPDPDWRRPVPRRRLRPDAWPQPATLTRSAGCIIAADTGPWLLAEAGHLAGRRATLHWQPLSEFAEACPDVITTPDRFARDGRYVTCGSASTALDVILDEIASRFGPAARFDAAAMFLNDLARSETHRAPLAACWPMAIPPCAGS